MSDPDRPSAAAWLESKSAQAALVVVGVPWDAGLGGNRTPEAVRNTLDRFSTFHSEAEVNLGSLPVEDVGDWVIDDSDPDEVSADIERRASELDPTPFAVFLGGDPAITRPIANGLGTAALGLLTFSANHRVGPTNGPLNGAALNGLVEDGLPGDRICQIGVHDFSNAAADRDFCERRGMSLFPMDTVDLWGIEETVIVALGQLAAICERIYVSIDLSVLDAALAPGSPDSRPGGLSSRQLATAAFQCGRHPQVGAADFTGVDVDRDRSDLTVMNLTTAFLSLAAGLAARRTVDP